ncbi:MAG: hypothetical protein PHD76_02195 [Methylacidiphilales bacterium]|nr:hypothetical protein [Candidatus Methylacidiphilales bacterium]
MAEQQQAWDYEAPPDRAYQTAKFRCWIPPGLKSLRAILVLLPGQNADGRPAVEEPQWQDFAAKESLALVGVFFEGDAVRDYSQAERGSGLTLIRAIEDFSRKPQGRDLLLARIFLRGSSSGGQFAYSFTQYQPQRVAGFACSNGLYFTSFPTGGGQRVPGLFAVDGAESDERVQKNLDFFGKNRERGALWSFVRYAESSEGGAATEFDRKYISAVLTARLNPLSPLSALENVTEILGWGGQLQTRAVLSARQIPRGQEPQHAWFVNEKIARDWAVVAAPIHVKAKPPSAPREYQ